MIAFGREEYRDFQSASSKEWLETNGLGGYASGTITGANTRRYHGLLVAALRPPTRRVLLLSKLEETLAVRDLEYDLSCNQYPGAVHPEGYRYLLEFRLDPFPTFVYEVGGGQPIRLEKAVGMCAGYQAVIVRYRVLSAPGTVSLVVRPMLNCRDHHQLTQENADLNPRAEIAAGRDLIMSTPYPDGPSIHIHFPHAYFEPWPDWYRNFEYLEERARGLDHQEDQYSPGFFTCDFEPGDTRYLTASTESPEHLDPAEMLEAERQRRSFLIEDWRAAPEPVQTLVAAADSFVVTRGKLSSRDPSYGVIAGYHWFEEWGRDAMIALPGLTLVTGRAEVARSVLRTFVRHQSQGLIPNRIPDADATPDYNTVDATLWMFWAAHKYLDHTGDRKFVAEELLPALLETIAWHVRGTYYGTRVAEDGLVTAGDASTQLTWMDAKVGDWVVTPRHGKAVEINALWHHALRFVEELGATHGGPAAEEVAERFLDRFWDEELGYLCDVVDGEGEADRSLRPNQIMAVSLPYPLLPLRQARSVVEAVRRNLLTPYGLRTLSPDDASYRGRYQGDQVARDGAYHQGTVWPWLLGQFITAYLAVAEDEQAARAEAEGWLGPLWDHLRTAGLGSISEIFEGAPPHAPRGCIAQAWSVAELLRAAIEDLGLAERGAG